MPKKCIAMNVNAYNCATHVNQSKKKEIPAMVAFVCTLQGRSLKLLTYDHSDFIAV